MPAQLSFLSGANRRRILVVDDEPINRELLGAVLSDEYDVIYAGDGLEALGIIRAQRDQLSLVLLDVLMPRMDGLALLGELRRCQILDRLPVIVLTSDSSLEVKSLSCGAIDFIPKPYPQADVILARVLRTIELMEDRDIIRSTERDVLTGLYNREYFYRYASQADQYQGAADMDAIMLDVNHFRMINERYGKAYADDLLRHIAKRLSDAVGPKGGILCRHSADSFMIYAPHGLDYKALLDEVSSGFASDDPESGRVRLRMGVYPNVDQAIEIERRFDRAKSAADTARNSYTHNIAFYDKKLHDLELYRMQLIEDFHDALCGGQFKVWYQPKFDIRPDVPALAGAEALVRWQHPTLGMISPGDFIPLFEENGLIQQLDEYVWRRAAEQIRRWKDRFHITMPVSVNVSRVDMYDPRLVDTFERILNEYGVTADDIHLEITESAYTRDSAQMIGMVSRLRNLGFCIEMDDFGTGYSSLNMISRLPIDALKLDMQFIRAAFGQHTDTRLIEVIIDIADYLNVPVIAEGVETEEQMKALKALGCDIVQGYYFSKPVIAEDYERFIAERQSRGAVDIPRQAAVRDGANTPRELGNIVSALSANFESVCYLNARTGRYSVYLPAEASGGLRSVSESGSFYNAYVPELTAAVDEEDRARVLGALDKDTLLALVAQGRTQSLDYRAHGPEKAGYYRMKCVPVDDGQLVIGIEDIQEEIERELAYQRELGNARSLALRDALTGVKNKHAFTNAIEDWNTRIREGLADSFALVVFDINNLKRINDSQGHMAGDRYIRQACSVICNLFKHSPVFRIGGDEFAAILSGQDYENRDALLNRLDEINQAHQTEGDVSISYGLAVADLAVDREFTPVFDRADASMYEYKKRFKVTR